MAISIVLPTYNEKENIVDLIRTILEVLYQGGIEARVIVVDDNSPDGTAAEVRKAFPSHKSVEVLVRTEERGLATAIARGINSALTEIVAVMDTDFNHNPRDLPRLLDQVGKHDLVIGSRYARGGGMRTSRFRYLGSYVFNLFIRLVLGTPIKDSLSGFLVIKKAVLRTLEGKAIFYGYGDYCIRLLHHALRAGFKIVEVPVVYEFRMGGESKTNFVKYLVTYTRAVIRLRFGPS